MLKVPGKPCPALADFRDRVGIVSALWRGAIRETHTLRFHPKTIRLRRWVAWRGQEEDSDGFTIPANRHPDVTDSNQVGAAW
jgi:hypothetical protein